MPQRREGLRLVFRLLAILAVVLIPFGIFSYLYFDRQYDYHVNRNFRVLTEVEEHLSALLRQFESFFDVDPYNEIEKTGYPIRAIVEERFAEKKDQPVVEKFLEALEDVESAGEETDEEGGIAEKIEAFRNALKAGLDKREGSADWTDVASTQREALLDLSTKRDVQPYEEDEEKENYSDSLTKIQKGQLEELRERVKFFNKNPVYQNLRVFQIEDSQCQQLNPKEPIHLQTNTPKAKTSLSIFACQREHTKFTGNFEAKLSLADLMRNIDAEAESFDLLVLAQEDGTVIYSSAETPSEGIPKSVFSKFSSLKPFFQKDQSEATIKEAAPKDSQSSIPLLSIIQEAEDGQVSIPLASIIREAKDAQMSIPLVSVTREAEISGTTYLLFLQPFQPPFPIMSQGDKDSANKQSLQSADDQQVWYIGGIIRKGEFQKKSLAVPLTVTGLAVLGLILGILSLPYVKLFFANAGEPLKATDIFFLVISLVLSSGLITLLLLNTVAYHNMRNQFDTTVEDIKKRIKDGFGKELDDALDTLSVAPIIVAEKEPLKLPLNDYPSYESVFLVNGKEVLEPAKWRTYPPRKSTEPISLSERQYFTHARDERDLWKRKEFPDFFIERVHSYTDGVKLSIISQHHQDCEQSNQKEVCFPVAALAKRFLSLRALALPPNFGFAVIEDNTGKVLFHSDDQRSLIENFFWETDNNLALQAAVHARQDCETEQAREDCKIAGHYNGRKHHFFVTPIESVPWSLVIFYDTRLLETVNFEIGVVAAGMFFLYVIPFVLAIAIRHFFVSRERWSWCWPQSKFQNHYAYVVVPVVLVVLDYVLGIWLLEGWPLFLSVVFLPLLVLGLLYLYLKLKSKTPASVWSQKLIESTASKLSFRSWYLSVVFLSVLAVFVFPSMAIFQNVFRVQAERFTEFRESEFVTALEKREKKLLSDIYGLASRNEVEEKIDVKSEKFIEDAICPGLHSYTEDEMYLLFQPVNHRIGMEDDICSSEGAPSDPSKEDKGDSNQNWHISEWFIDFLPVYNELAGKLRYPTSKQASLSHSEDGVKIRYQALPSLPVFLPRGDLDYRIAIYLCILLFLIVLFLLIRALAKRTVGLYLFDFEVLGKDSEETTVHNLALPYGPAEQATIKDLARTLLATKTETDKKRRVLIRPPRALVSELKKADDDQSKDNQSKFEVVDLSSPIPPLLGKLIEYSTTPPSEGILVTNFEAGILESRLRLALLEMLECIQAKIPVILCSSVSPLHHLVTPEAYPEFDEGIQDAVPKADEKFRWSALLSTFRKERFWYKAPDWRDEKGELQILSRECCWTDELIPIYEDLKHKVKDLTGEQIIHQVGDRAGAFYRKLWMLCTKEERLILIHLAQGNMVNLKETDVLQRLLWRNLIRRNPDFRLPNESFAHFVLTAEWPARIVEWEKGEADGSTWTMLRVPFLLLLVLVAAFIARTGGEGVQAMTAIVSAVFAGLPILLQALSFLRGGQTDKLTAE